ncbi:hypothetical protein [Roseivirga sp.]|uniref:AbiU2 domain-containing protein n=1 Tax=Roseivirga sp. TaxID=1964215 RepID=UPI002B268DDF|nr:hypothetical protein [Roseivirga sp.]
MKEDLQTHFENGFFINTQNANFHFEVFELIASEHQSIKMLKEEEQALFVYLQHSAEIQLMLNLSKCFEKVDPRNPNRSINTFHKKYKNSIKEVKIDLQKASIETFRTTPYLTEKQYQCNTLGEFLTKSLEIKEEKFGSLMKDIKTYRDKFIAHNEIHQGLNVNKKKTSELIEFNKSIIYVIGYYLFEAHYVTTQNNKFLGGTIDRKTTFIKLLLEEKCLK